MISHVRTGLRLATIGLAPLLVGSAFTTAGWAQPQDEVFVLTSETNDEWEGHESTSIGPGSDWNHFDMKVAEKGLRSIMPNYLSGNPLNIEEMNRFNKHLVPETVFFSTGQIGTWYQNGTLHAVEFAVLSDDPFPPPGPTERLSVKGIIEGDDTQGVYGVLGYMYCYDEAKYDARIAALTTLMGGTTPAQPTVWLGSTLQSAVSTNKSMRLYGVSNTIYGGLHTNGYLLLGGESWAIPETLYRVGMFLQTGTGHELGTVKATTALSLPSPNHAAVWYLSSAIANGTYFAGDLTVYNDGQGGLQTGQGVALSGVVYATGDITIASSGLTGTVTFVAQGGIDFAGGDCLLTAAVDDLLMWSTSTIATDAIALDGSGCHLTGAIYAPGVEFRVGGSSNDLTGRVRAGNVKVTGSQNQFTDGTK